MDSLIEFVGYVFRKGQQYDSSDFDDYLWDKYWEDITRDVPVKHEEVLLGIINENFSAIEEETLVIFEEDCFALKIEAIIPLSCTKLQSGIQMMIEEGGIQETFEAFRVQLIKEAKELLKEEVSINNTNTLCFDLFKDETVIETKDFVRMLTVWSFKVIGSDEDVEFEWDLMGTVEQSEIRSIIHKIEE